MLDRINAFVWGVPVLGLILLTGIWLSVRTGFVQIRLFPAACRELWRRLRSRDSGFRALCTALAATVGTGNVAGVAGAIALGGPGAVFWMWVSAFFGMAVKFAESTLAVRFREPDGRAGPSYIICKGLGERWRWMARVYSLFGLVAAFGVGNAAQVNAVADCLRGAGASRGFVLGVGILMAAAVARMVMGGAKAIAGTAEALVPVVGGAYILLCLLAVRWDRAGEALGRIILGAFSPEAVTGGAVGSMLTAVRTGVSRGTFTNEAGMGTAAIAHGSAARENAADQGLMGLMEVFLDTIVICTLTALVILTGGVSIPYGEAAGAELTAGALAAGLGDWVRSALCGCLVLFALAAILGWSFYAGRCAEFLFGRVSWKWLGLLEGGGVLAGLLLNTAAVWTLAELFNGLMALPNLLAVLLLTGDVRILLKVDSCSRNMVSSHRGDDHETKAFLPSAGGHDAAGMPKHSGGDGSADHRTGVGLHG